MKVRVIFETQGAFVEVLSECGDEDRLLRAAFGECELRAKLEHVFESGLTAHNTSRARLLIKTFA